MSIELEGGEPDLRSLTDPSAAEDSGIPGSEGLLEWVDATLRGEAEEIARARDRVRAELGSAAMIDAAGVIGNFERMVRIADGTGIPLDQGVNVATEDVRKEIGIDGFESAGRSKTITPWQRAAARIVTPLLTFGLKLRARQSNHSND